MRTASVLLLLVVPAFAQPTIVGQLGSTKLRHQDRPLALAFTADGKFLVSGGADGTIRLWDIRTGTEVKRTTIPGGACVTLAAADGVIVGHFADEKLRPFDATTLAPRRPIIVPNLDTVALTADGKLFAAVGWANQALFRDVASGLDRLELPSGRAVAVAADGSRVAVAEATESVSVFDALSGQVVAKVQHLCRDAVTTVALNRTGSRLAAADSGPTSRVRVWDIGTAAPVAEWFGEGQLVLLDKDRVIGRRGGAVAVWRIGAKEPERTFAAGVGTLAISPDGTLAATAGDGARISVWDIATGEERKFDTDGYGTIAGLAASANGMELVLVGSRAVVRWQPGHDSAIVARPPVAVTVAGFDRTASFAAGPDGIVRLTPTLRVQPGVGVPVSVAVSAEVAVVGTDDKRLVRLDARTGKTLGEWPVPGVPLGLAVIPATTQVAGVGRDGFFRLWDTTGPDLKEIWKVRVPRSLRAAVAVSPDGSLVAVTSVVRTEVYDVATGKRQFVLERKWEDGPFQCVTFSDDGRLLATGSAGGAGTAVVWEVATRNPVARITGGTGSVAKVAFLAGGQQLAVAGADDNVAVWQFILLEKTASWAALARLDAAAGVTSVFRLAAEPNAVKVIRDGIENQNTTSVAVKRLIADLGAPQFTIREKASAALPGYGLMALPAVLEAVASNPSQEVRLRAEEVTRRMQAAGEILPDHGLYGERLQLARAVWVLERVGGPEELAVLESLAKRSDEAGHAAIAALARLRAK